MIFIVIFNVFSITVIVKDYLMKVDILFKDWIIMRIVVWIDSWIINGMCKVNGLRISFIILMI